MDYWTDIHINTFTYLDRSSRVTKLYEAKKRAKRQLELCIFASSKHPMSGVKLQRERGFLDKASGSKGQEGLASHEEGAAHLTQWSALEARQLQPEKGKSYLQERRRLVSYTNGQRKKGYLKLFIVNTSILLSSFPYSCPSRAFPFHVWLPGSKIRVQRWVFHVL